MPLDVLRCVAFAASQADSDPAGTVFFVRIHEDDPDWKGPVAAVYAVTAKHLLEDFRDQEASDAVYLRLNLRAGGMRWARTDIANWIQHQTSDVAVLPWPLDPGDDIEPFPLRKNLIGDIVRDWQVGVGDEVFIAGLFWHHAGRSKNIPIVRVGNIAAMTGEPVFTQRYRLMDAYLIEMRSLGGLSGSPVFFNGDGIRRVNTEHHIHQLSGHALTWGFFLMGVIYGHYRNSSRTVDDAEEKINSGIAIVTPIEKVFELIFSGPLSRSVSP